MADFLRQKYFYDLNYNRSINKTLQRSNSVVPFTSNEHLALMESPELLFYISLDILSFRSNLLRYCNDLIKDLADIEPFFQTHQDASLYLQSLQTNWNNEWMRGFFLIEAEMKELIKKHNLKLEEKLLKSIAEDAECYHQPKTKNNSKKLKVINDLVEAPKNLMKSRLALKDNRYSPISNCSSGSTIIKVTSISPLSNASSSSTIEVTPENCVISTIAEIHHRNNALDHMNTSVDNVSDILDAISDNGLKSEDSFNLRLSTSSSEISLKKRKLSSPDQVFKDVLGQKEHTLKKTCVVNISFSEQEICNKRIKSSCRNGVAKQDDRKRLGKYKI